MLLRADGSMENLPGKLTSQIMHPGDADAVETPGAGGYGSPKERSREKLAEDLCSGKFTRRYIEDHYGSDVLVSLHSRSESKSSRQSLAKREK